MNENILSELPVGFSMALARNENALERYAALSPAEKTEIINRAKSACTRAEMDQLVLELDS